MMELISKIAQIVCICLLISIHLSCSAKERSDFVPHSNWQFQKHNHKSKQFYFDGTTEVVGTFKFSWKEENGKEEVILEFVPEGGLGTIFPAFPNYEMEKQVIIRNVSDGAKALFLTVLHAKKIYTKEIVEYSRRAKIRVGDLVATKNKERVSYSVEFYRAVEVDYNEEENRFIEEECSYLDEARKLVTESPKQIFDRNTAQTNAPFLRLYAGFVPSIPGIPNNEQVCVDNNYKLKSVDLGGDAIYPKCKGVYKLIEDSRNFTKEYNRLMREKLLEEGVYKCSE